MWRSRLGAALLSAFLLLPAAANDNPRWQKIKSSNFELFTDAGAHSGCDLSRRFEQIHGFFLDALGLDLSSIPPARIVVFRSQPDFARYAPNESAAAFYLGTQERDYIVLTIASAARFNIALHEYSHLLVKHSGVAVPLWFNEGLAELYSSVSPAAGKTGVGDPIAAHLELLRQSKWIDLPTLLAVRKDSPLYGVKSHAGLFYAESWALVHMLYLDARYRPRLPYLLAAIKAGMSMADTFQAAYSKSIEHVWTDLELYVHARRFHSARLDTARPKPVDAPEISESNSLETGLLLAEILAHVPGKAADGREDYNRLARENPKDWRIEEGLARLSMRERKMDEALRHYAKAAELGSDDAKMYLDYGRLLRVADKRAEAVPVLKRATEIDPNNRDARLELGYAYVLDDQPGEAVAQFQLVTNITPEQGFGYFHSLAYALYRLDRRAEARVAVATCRTYAKTPEQIESLQHLVALLGDDDQKRTGGHSEEHARRPVPHPRIGT